jgi:hypothetical protein
MDLWMRADCLDDGNRVMRELIETAGMKKHRADKPSLEKTVEDTQ